MNTLIDQLAAAKPVPEPPSGDADALLAAILAEPRRTRTRPTGARGASSTPRATASTS
jgi:hypothetical protein